MHWKKRNYTKVIALFWVEMYDLFFTLILNYL